MKRACKGCGADISKKHKNAKFCTQKCKDTFHNWTNPRGKFKHLNDDHSNNYIEEGWDGHKGSFK